MENWYRIQSALLAAIICTTLAVHLFLRGRRNRLNRGFAFFNINLVAWFIVDALIVSETLPREWGFVARGFVASLIPVTCVGFFVEFAEERSRLAQVAYRISWLATLALAASTTLRWPSEWVWRQSILLGTIMVAVIISTVILIRRYRSVESTVDRARLQVLILAGFGVFAIATISYLPAVNSPSLGNILLAVYMFFMFEVITLRRLLDLFEFLGRFLVLSGFAVVLSVIYIILVGWWRHDFKLFALNTVIATIVVLILFDPLRNFVQDKLNQLVFREKFEFTKQLEHVRASMANIIDVQELADFLMERLEASRRVTHASLWLGEQDGLAFKSRSFVGTEPPARLEAMHAGPFLTMLSKERFIAIENIEAERSYLTKQGDATDQVALERLEQILKTLESIQSALCIGIFSGGQLVGFLTVRDERRRGAYSTDEIKALAALVAQTTITIENSQMFAGVRERYRLAALGEMAAGLAHEIRNPLGAIKGAAQLLTEESDAKEGYLEIIDEEVQRLDGVVSQFLSYARPIQMNRDPVDVNHVLERTLTLLTMTESKAEISFVPAPDLPTIRSDAQLLRQVALNLARNALEAMEEAGGTLTITTSLSVRRTNRLRSNRSGADPTSFVRIRFQDTGPGISPEVMERLFIPFFTTKPKGTGLGLAICQRIIRNLGGLIDVNSRLGDGTTFSIYLPVSEGPVRSTVSG